MLAASLQMVTPFFRQSDHPTPSTAKRPQRLWTVAPCPIVDHDAHPEGVSSNTQPPISPSCVAIMAASAGTAVANLYYNQPMLPEIGRSFGVAANVIALLPMLTQIGYALGLFLFVPLGDVVDRHRLVLALLCGIIGSLGCCRGRPPGSQNRICVCCNRSSVFGKAIPSSERHR
jgi:hypothetical protein